MNIFKFGGASIKDADSIRHMKRILDSYEENIIVVVSAMGKMTNALEELHQSYILSDGSFDSKLNNIKEYHTGIIKELFNEDHMIFDLIQGIFSKLATRNLQPATSYDFEYDQMVSFGEILSTTIVSEYLNLEQDYCKHTDIRDILKTDKQYREANVDWELTESLCKEYFTFKNTSRYITQGFIGGAFGGSTTTLGREGSDYTAAILANILDAEKVIFWKDVPGILNADPGFYNDTVKLDNISYREAIELSFYGAKIIHPKTIKPLENKKIPLYVKPFFAPHEQGSLININGEGDELIPSFIFKINQSLISITPRDFSFILEDNLSEIFGALAEVGIKINLMQTSAINFSVCIDHDDSKIEVLRKKLDWKYKVFYNTGLELASIRHYDQATIDRVTAGKKIFLEQRTRNMARFVFR